MGKSTNDSRLSDQQPAAAAIATLLSRMPIVRRVILFGSRARGSAAERSDIDLAVDAEGGSAADWQRILDVVDEADTLLKIDAVRLDTLPDEDPLNRAIRRDGIVLFDRSERHDRG